MVSLTSATVGLRDQPVELADDGGDLRLQRRLVGGGCGGGGCGGGTVRPVGQGLFDAAQSAFDAADGQAGFVQVEVPAQALAAGKAARTSLTSTKCGEIGSR